MTLLKLRCVVGTAALRGVRLHTNTKWVTDATQQQNNGRRREAEKVEPRKSKRERDTCSLERHSEQIVFSDEIS